MIECLGILNGSSGGPLSPVDRLTRCFLEVRGELLQFFARRTGRTGAEDLVQDVWVRLRERSDPASWVEPRAFIFTVAANLATDAGRRTARDMARLSFDQAAMASVPANIDPSTEADLANRIERVAAALAQLPAVCRDAFLLNRLESLTHAEIAELLGVSRKSVQRYLERTVLHILRASRE
jgi:RNA polymerase sigma factor (sigma-70 family)